MENEEELDMGNEVTKFWVTIHVMNNAVLSFVRAWNCHRIPGAGGGVPNTLAGRNNRITRLVSVPSTSHMLQLHKTDGSHLCREVAYGSDPLTGHEQLQ